MSVSEKCIFLAWPEKTTNLKIMCKPYENMSIYAWKIGKIFLHTILQALVNNHLYSAKSYVFHFSTDHIKEQSVKLSPDGFL